MSSSPPGWHPDPQSRHQHRFWDGNNWTDQVSDDGVVTTDPLQPTPATSGSAGPDAGGGDQRGDGRPPAADATVIGAAGGFGPSASPPPGSLPSQGSSPPPGAPSSGSSFGASPPPGAPPQGSSPPGAAGPPPGASGPPPGSSASPPGSNTPPPPKSSSKLPFIIVGIVVLIGVLIAGFLLLKGGGGGTADGDYKLTVKKGQVTVRKLNVKAGEALYVSIKGNNLRRALAIDGGDYKKYIDQSFVNTDNTSDLRTLDARGYFSDDKDLRKQLSDFDTSSPKYRFPGFNQDVVLLRTFVGGSNFQPYRGQDETFIAPIAGTYYIAIRSTKGDEEVNLSIRTKTNKDVKSDLDTSAYTDLIGSDSGFYSDFFTDATDQVNSSGS